MPKSTKKLPISAKTGRIVTDAFAKKHPATTVELTVKKSKKSK